MHFNNSLRTRIKLKVLNEQLYFDKYESYLCLHTFIVNINLSGFCLFRVYDAFYKVTYAKFT